MIITQFGGIENTVAKRDIKDNSLQDAVNVDLTDAGAVIARAGRVSSMSVTVDAVYTTVDNDTYIVSSGVLYRVGDGLVLYRIGSSSATEFSDYQTALFTGDGKQVLNDAFINLNTVVGSQPAIVVTGGNLPAGRYSIVVTYTNANGLEGGTTQVLTVEVEDNSEILVTPQDIAGHTPNVYMTSSNGSVFFNRATGLRINHDQINASPFPADVEKIEYHESRLYVSVRLDNNTVIYRSKPAQFHLFGLDGDYFIIPGKVLDMRSTTGGLVIGTDSEIYVIQDDAIQRLAPYGVIPGRPMVKTPTGQLLIHTMRGVCRALPFEPLTEASVSLPMGSTCSTALMFKDGISRYIAMHNGEGEAFNKAY